MPDTCIVLLRSNSESFSVVYCSLIPNVIIQLIFVPSEKKIFVNRTVLKQVSHWKFFCFFACMLCPLGVFSCFVVLNIVFSRPSSANLVSAQDANELLSAFCTCTAARLGRYIFPHSNFRVRDLNTLCADVVCVFNIGCDGCSVARNCSNGGVDSENYDCIFALVQGQVWSFRFRL